MRISTVISLLQCQSLIEELSASHSTDLQQRAYELQAVISLDAHAIGSVMPLDASCEDIEVFMVAYFLSIIIPCYGSWLCSTDTDRDTGFLKTWGHSKNKKNILFYTSGNIIILTLNI